MTFGFYPKVTFCENNTIPRNKIKARKKAGESEIPLFKPQKIDAYCIFATHQSFPTMKKHYLLLFLLLPFCATAQKFRFGISVAPSVSGALFTNDGTIPTDIENQFRDIEIPRVAGYAHFFAEYQFSERTQLQVGAGYGLSGFADKERELSFSLPEPAPPQKFSAKYTFHQLRIPVLLKYAPLINHTKWYLIGGVVNQYSIAEKADLQITNADGTTINTTTDYGGTSFRKYNLNAALGTGFNFRLGKLDAFIQPMFDVNLLGISKSASLNRHIWSAGLNVGVVL